MKNKYVRLGSIGLILLLLLSGCGENTPVVETPQDNTPKRESNLIIFAMNVLDSIKTKDMNELSTYVHPTDGVRFTPYEYVDMQNDKVFTASEVLGLNSDTHIYTWGVYDGIGDPIDLDFNGYYDEFIYDVDFINPHLIGNNVPIGVGNMINNLSEEYPNAEFIEFHFTGFDPQYEGMDWKTLRLVFEDVEGVWYLVGVIHGQWTI